MWDGSGSEVVLRTKPFETVMDVKRMVARRYGVSVKALEGPRRNPEFAHPRQVAMALAYRRLKSKGVSYPLIAREFGNRHWTTVIFACRKFGINADPRLAEIARRGVENRRRRIKAEAEAVTPKRTPKQLRDAFWMREAGFLGGQP